MLYAGQIRAARGMLRISALELSKASGLALFTIQRLEKDDKAIRKASMDTITKIKEALEARGIKFLPPKERGGVSYGIGIRYMSDLGSKKEGSEKVI